MRKEAIAALFVALLSLSMVATVGAPYTPPEKDLPPDVVLYTASIENSHLENWWGIPTYYKGVYVIKLTAEVFTLTNMATDIIDIATASMSGKNLVVYTSVITIDWLTIEPWMIEDPNVQKELHDLLGDPCDIPGAVLSVVSMEASNVVVSGFSLAQNVGTVSTTMGVLTLSKYKITGVSYPGLWNGATKMTGNMDIKDQTIATKVGTCRYTLTGPDAKMVNAVGYASKVSGYALGFIWQSWSGNDLPFLIRLAGLMFKTVFMTLVSMTVLEMTAASATMTSMKLDISA